MHVRVCARVRVLVRVRVSAHARVCVCVRAGVRACMCLSVCVRPRVCAHACVCLRARVHMCVWLRWRSRAPHDSVWHGVHMQLHMAVCELMPPPGLFSTVGGQSCGLGLCALLLHPSVSFALLLLAPRCAWHASS